MGNRWTVSRGLRWGGAVAALPIALVACGTGSGGGASLAGGSAAGGVVRTGSVPGVGTVLEDGSGHVLYTPAQESSGTIRCAKGCVAVWPPLAVNAGTPLPAPAGVTGTFGVVKRPDGMRQLTFDGRPLYRFSFDAPGAAKGNGVSDSFGGRAFTWHAVTTSGAAAPASSPAGGYSY